MRDRRRCVAQSYDQGFAGLPEVIVPARSADVEHAWHLYPIRLRLDALRIGRDAVIEELKARGIGTSVHFIPLHMHPYYRSVFGYEPGEFPNASAAFTSLISLPIYPSMTHDGIERVVAEVSDIVVRNRR